mgnify:FL=1
METKTLADVLPSNKGNKKESRVLCGSLWKQKANTFPDVFFDSRKIRQFVLQSTTIIPAANMSLLNICTG